MEGFGVERKEIQVQVPSLSSRSWNKLIKKKEGRSVDVCNGKINESRSSSALCFCSPLQAARASPERDVILKVSIFGQAFLLCSSSSYFLVSSFRTLLFARIPDPERI